MSANIEALATKATWPLKPKNILNEPAKRKIQHTSGFLKVQANQRSIFYPFPQIDEEAFKMSYFDEALGLELPVFQFFDVDDAPSNSYVYQGQGHEIAFAHHRGSDQVAMPNRQQFIDLVKKPFYNRLKIWGIACAVGVVAIILAFIFLPWVAKIIVSGAVLSAALFSLATIAKLHVEKQTRIELTTEIEHIIPDNVIERIDKVLGKSGLLDPNDDSAEELERRKEAEQIKGRKWRFERLAIVADVQNQWKMDIMQVDRPPAPPDPLLIGMARWEGKMHYYMVDKFELTPIEHYISTEFQLADTSGDDTAPTPTPTV